jgi:hypothetical protein
VSTPPARPASPPWWALLPPAEAQVTCGEQAHRLRWAEGLLTAVDHPDAEEELVLAALGGDRSECVDLVEWWGSRGDDLEVLAVGPRSAADELTVTPENVGEFGVGQGGWIAYAPLGMGTVTALRARHTSALHPIRLSGPVQAMQPWAQRLPGGMAIYGALLGRWGPTTLMRRRAAMQATAAMRRQFAAGRSPYGGPVAAAAVRTGRVSAVRTGRVSGILRQAGPGRQFRDQMRRAGERRAELFSLLALGPEFQLRLSATVAAARADGGRRAAERDTARPALVAALAGRLAPAAQDWLGVDPGRVDVSLHEGEGWGRLALSGTGRDRRLSAALPAGWLASVWAAGLAVTGGHLIVAVTSAAWPEATVLGVPEPGADPVILKVRAVAGDGAAPGVGWVVAAAGDERDEGDGAP